MDRREAYVFKSIVRSYYIKKLSDYLTLLNGLTAARYIEHLRLKNGDLRLKKTVERLLYDMVIEENKHVTDLVIENYVKFNTIIIAANGPSLNNYDFDVVNLFPVLALNRGYLKKEMMYDYLFVVNDLVIGQFFNEIEEDISKKFWPVLVSHKRPNLNIQHVPISYTPDTPSFQKSPLKEVWQGHTVTYVALQYAYWMGSRKVILIGLDHNYPDADGKPTNMEEYLEEDNSHFTKEYFSNARWHTPNLEKSEEAYRLARDAYLEDGRMIINATPDSRLSEDIFPKMDLQSALELGI